MVESGCTVKKLQSELSLHTAIPNVDSDSDTDAPSDTDTADLDASTLCHSCRSFVESLFRPLSEFCASVSQRIEFNIFFTCLVVFNVVVLCLNYYNMPSTLRSFCSISNAVMTWLYAVEILIKFVAMGPKDWAADAFNLFDFFVVVAALVEYLLSNSSAVVSSLRAFRAIRVFKLFRSWSSMVRLMEIVKESLWDLRDFVILMSVFVFVFALICTNMFQGQMNFPEGLPRANFDSFAWSCISVLQVHYSSISV
jgi:hypothetical protein